MRYFNHKWEIDKLKYSHRVVGNILKVVDDYLHLLREGQEYRMPLRFIEFYVPLNKYYIRMDKVNKYLERIN